MQDHQVPEQMLGYLYQVQSALSLLLENDNPDYQICIEKFDDIAFSKDGIPKQLIQMKHHIKRQGKLTDASTDLWRTLKVWLDEILESPDILTETEFLIITTSIAPNGTVAYCLKDGQSRKTEGIYEKLKTVCVESANKYHKRYYEAFLNADEDIIKKLIERIHIIDGASDIIDVKKIIRKQIRYSCIPKYEDHIFDRLMGWWYQKTIEVLCSNTPSYVTQNQVRALIVTISQEYSDDNLPIDIFEIESCQGQDLSEKVFCEQLKLIRIGKRRLQIALRDYYRAFKQRASWVRNDLLYVDELEDYERRLIDEWEHSFADMEDNLTFYKEVTEDDKIKKGRDLFTEIEKKEIYIRPKCQEAFIMRGSYHMLANQLKVGWHVDYYDRLSQS